MIEIRKKRQLCLTTMILFITLVVTGCITTPSTSDLTGYEGETKPWIILGKEETSSITVSWLSSKAVPTRLLFGQSEGALTVLEEDAPRTRHHQLTLEGLLPDTTYYYAPLFFDVPDDKTEVFHFTTPPDSPAPFRAVIVGDMQPKPKETVTLRGGALVAEGIARENPDLVVQLGDIASIGGVYGHWKLVLNNISRFSPYVPLQTIPGNHDQYLDKGRNYARLFPHDFEDPKGLYYSFNYGDVHFVMMNAFERRGKELSEAQKVWVEDDINEARSQGAQWIFLILHNTVLSTGTCGTTESLLTWIVPLADRLEADGVFFGHDHHYEHWMVEYGKNNLVFDPSHEPRGNPIHYWCAGGGGGRLEIDYGLLTRDPRTFIRQMYDAETGEPAEIEILQNPWDESRFIDHTDDPDYGQPYGGKHYWQAPDVGTCQTDTDLFGYRYGEQTLHYILMEVEEDTITISVRYHNGDPVSGPEGRYPQEFILLKD